MTPDFLQCQSSEDGMERDLRGHYDLSLARLLRVLLRRRWLILCIFALVVAASAALGVLLPKRYAADALVQLSFGEATQQVGAGSNNSAASIALDAAALVKGETEIIASRAIARRVIASNETAKAFAFVNSKTGEDAILAIEKPLSVLNDGKSYLIRVRFEAGSPEVAATIANGFADAYLANRAEEGAAVAKGRRLWLAQQAEEAKRVVDKASRQLQDFAERSGVVAPAAGSLSPSEQQMRDLLSQLSAKQATRREKELRLERLRQSLEQGDLPSVVDLEGATEAQRLVDAEITSRRDLVALGASLGERHPRYRRAEAAIEALKTQRVAALSDAIGLAQNDLLSARLGEQTLLGDVAAMQRVVVADSSQLQTALHLQTSWQSAVTNLDQLRSSLREAQATGDFKPVSANLVSPAEPVARPVSTRLLTALAIGVLGGIFAALAAVFFLETRDNGYAEVAEAERGLNLPCVGVIPTAARAKKPGEARTRDAALRSLAARLSLTDRAATKQLIVIGSALPAEGKTSLTHDLAAIVAQVGRRVVVVETSPAGIGEQHGTLRGQGDGDPSQWLMVTAIAQRTQEGQLSMRSYQRPNESVSPFFESPDALLDWLKTSADQFDLVLVEAPALLLDGRAIVLARAADLFILAVAWRRTSRAALAATLDQLTTLSKPLASVVFAFTDVKLRQHKGYGPSDALYFQNRHLNTRRANFIGRSEARAT